MGYFSANYSHGKKFDVNADDFPFCELSELVKENGHKTLTVQGLFTYEIKKGKRKGKIRACLIADSHKINLPDHMLAEVEKLIDDDEAVKLINAGHCGFETSEYEDTKNGNGTCYSGSFVDI